MKELKSERIIFSASPQFIERIDKFRAAHPSLPSRAQAIRTLTTVGLDLASNRPLLEELNSLSGKASKIMAEIAKRAPDR